MGARLNEAGAKAQAQAASGAIPNALPKGGFFGTVVDAFKEEYRLAMMDPGDAAAERRKQQPGYVAPARGDTSIFTRSRLHASFTRRSPLSFSFNSHVYV